MILKKKIKFNFDKFLSKFYLYVILIKGIDGFFDLFTGILLFRVDSNFLVNIIKDIFSKELISDPNDLIANYLLSLFTNMNISTQHFAGIYFLSHGIIKIIIAFALFSKNLILHFFSGILLFFLIDYQLYKLYNNFTFFLFFLTLLDIIIFVLLLREYKKLKLYLENLI